ncbi:MAG TPA: type 1 glutamine amidotransferase [Gaiellaceae bacterium]|nr:type 1 glutamine amidotransferase [Gaiellaceae bacterium]
MRILAIVHGADAPAGSFGDVVAERGHLLDEWRIATEPAPPAPAEEYGAVMIFGGGMHADQEAEHPWLGDEHAFIEGLLERGTPLLGVCLGAQLIAKAAGARVARLAEPEVGWFEVDVSSDGDPVLGALAPRLLVFQWHFYGFDVPARAWELASSPSCPQAFRLGDAAWGVQFHPEVTTEIVARWIDESPDEAPAELLAQTEQRIDEWMRVGRELCGAFVDAAGG